jgi:hypothetical protein
VEGKSGEENGGLVTLTVRTPTPKYCQERSESSLVTVEEYGAHSLLSPSSDYRNIGVIQRLVSMLTCVPRIEGIM